jgi:hypothetical protein
MRIFQCTLGMNLPISIDKTEHLNLHFLLEEDSCGQIVGTIAELPGCQVSARTQEDAIGALQQMAHDRMAKITVVPFTTAISSEKEKRNPWLKHMGMYEDDADFAEIAAELRKERGLDDVSWKK